MNKFYNRFIEVLSSNREKVAIIDGDRSFSYEEVSRLAKKLSSHLNQVIGEKEGAVVVLLPRSAELIISFLAVAFSRHQFIPLSPSMPEERMKMILNSVHPDVIISSDYFALTETDNLSDEISVCERKERTPLYTLFTSGSTGTPKGITVGSKNFLNFIEGMEESIGFSKEDVFLAQTFTGFDISFLELYLPLFIGATVVIFSDENMHDADAIVNLINKHHVSVVQATPTFWNINKDTFISNKLRVKRLLVGGEALSLSLSRFLFDIGEVVYNMYGPTETTIWSTFSIMKKEDKKISIGIPIKNTFLLVQNENGEISETGKGELLIGGDGVSLGYLGRTELNQDKFIHLNCVPFFKSGDMVTIRKMGEIEYQGRLDNQVKIRGNRVELGEIESLIENLKPGLRAVVKVMNQEEGLLCAVLSSTSSPDVSTVSSWSEVWNDVYGESNVQAHELDTTGWINSFTQKMYSDAEIRDWRDSTVKRIKSVCEVNSNSHVLELGVGTGMILSSLLPDVGTYVGVDSSANAIEKLKARYSSSSKLRLETSDILSSLDRFEEKFNLIILNSVSQYFDSLDYLEKVLDAAISQLASGGILFIGDVRNLNHYSSFHSCRYLLGETSHASFQDFIKGVKETELLIHPDYFTWFVSSRGVELEAVNLLREDSLFTEMSAFRFDSILCKSKHSPKVKASKNPLLDSFDNYLKSCLERKLKPSYTELSQKWLSLKAEFPLDLLCPSVDERLHSSDFANIPDRKSKGNKALYNEIYRELEKCLPAYMLPQFFKMVDELPQTSSGKIDRNAINLEGAEGLELTQVYVPPKDQLENELIDILQEVLKSKTVGMLDNVWGLGLTSLSVARIVRKIKEQRKVSLKMIEFYHFQTCKDIANAVRTSSLTIIDPSAVAKLQSLKLNPLQVVMVQSSLSPALNKALNVCFHVKIKSTVSALSLKSFLVSYFNKRRIYSSIVSADSITILPRFTDDEFIQLVSFNPALVDSFFKKEIDVYQDRAVQILISKDKGDEVLFKFHHYSIDGESIARVLEDMRDFLDGNPVFPNELDDDQFHYNQTLQQIDSSTQIVYWKERLSQLQTASLELGIPTVRKMTFIGEEICQEIPESVISAILGYSTSKNVTPYSVYLYALFIAIQKQNQTNDVVIAIPVSGRHNSSYVDALGCFINFLPLRSNHSPERGHQQNLKEIQQRTYEYMENPGLTLNQILQVIDYKSDITTFISTAFAYDEDIYDVTGNTSQIESEEYFNGFTQFALSFRLCLKKNGPILKVQYDKGTYSKDGVREFISLYLSVLSQLCNDHSFDSIATLTKSEEQLISQFSRGATTSCSLSLSARLENTLTNPKTFMVLDTQFSLESLLSRIRLALSEVQDEKIGILMNENYMALGAQLACWSSGRAVVMMSPDWGSKRIEHIMKEAGVCTIFTDTDLLLEGAHLLKISIEGAENRMTYVDVKLLREHLLYVIYTSGTTGLPKGIQVTTQSFENFLVSLYAISSTFPVKNKRLLSMFSSTFDAFQLSVAMLLDQAELYFLPKKDQLNFEFLFRFVKEKGIEIAECPTSIIGMLLDNYFDELNDSGLKAVYFGGEALSQKTFNLMKACTNLKFYNLYGPAENTVISTISCVSDSSYDFPTIGKPLANQSLFILDASMKPCRVFNEGEIYVSGASLSKGYIKEELNKDKFISHPERAHEILYRTGDFGMWLPDGEIYFTGRKDGQVQLRGHRIELDEIDFQINQFLRQGLVRTTVLGQGNERKLVSFINPGIVFNHAKLLSYLRTTLPSYMIPNEIVDDIKIPLTSNGKIDFRFLIEAHGVRAQNLNPVEHDLLDNPIFQLLSGTIRGVLKYEGPILPDQNLFFLGGNSLTAIRLRRVLMDEIQVELSIDKIFTLTVRELVDAIDEVLINDET